MFSCGEAFKRISFHSHLFLQSTKVMVVHLSTSWPRQKFQVFWRILKEGKFFLEAAFS